MWACLSGSLHLANENSIFTGTVTDVEYSGPVRSCVCQNRSWQPLVEVPSWQRAPALPGGSTIDRCGGGAFGRCGMSTPVRRLLNMWRNSVILLPGIVLWGYIVGPLVATFQQSVTGSGGGLGNTEVLRLPQRRSGPVDARQPHHFFLSDYFRRDWVFLLGAETMGLSRKSARCWFWCRSRSAADGRAFVLLYGIGAVPQVLATIFHTGGTPSRGRCQRCVARPYVNVYPPPI